MTRAGTIRELYARVTTAPGVGNSRVFRIRLNAVNTALTVTIAGANTTGNDVVNTVAVVAGDLISIALTRVGAANATSISSVNLYYN